MEEIKCKRTNCNNLIPESRRAGSDYCSYWCGYTHRNREKRKENKERNVHTKKLNKNYNIIKDLYKKGFTDINAETLEILQFDSNYCTGIEKIDVNSTKIRLYEFTIICTGDRYKINKST